jgi:hypothetical protein
MQKIYKITINDLTIEVIQDNDGKFIKPSIIDDYNSFGTALKPAFEPIIVARKPFRTSVAENIMKYGVGGINIDECRVGNEHFEIKDGSYDNNGNQACFGNIKRTPKSYEGRFPANIILGYLEDEYLLKENITKDEKKKVMEWLNENA